MWIRGNLHELEEGVNYTVVKTAKYDALKASHTKLVEAIRKIEDDVPLELSHSEDARYHWPKRWRLMRQALAEAEKIGD